MSEYNSIITSQLENQRYYYLDLLRKTEDKFILENKILDRDIENLKGGIVKVDEETDKASKEKISAFEEVKERESHIKVVEKEFKESEEVYHKLIAEKNKTIEQRDAIALQEKKKISDLEEEIVDLEAQINDLNIHLNTLEKVKKDHISGASIEFVTSSKRKNKKK